MLTPFTLTGSRVRLEPLSLDHVDGIAAAAAEDRSSYGFTWVPDGVADAETYVLGLLRDHAAAQALPFTVLAADRVVGATRYLDLRVFDGPRPTGPPVCDDRPPSVLEIGGTWYAASAQRTGVNAEAKLLLMTHAFEVWHTVRVTLKTDARNARSRAAITRLGAAYEGIRRAEMPASDGTIRDSAYFSIVAAEWPAVAAELRRRLA